MNLWDTDQFPTTSPELALGFHPILKAGGFTTGGLNFDAKLRRQSIDPEDLFFAHIGGMDTCARALLAAAAMIEDGKLDEFVEERYAGWNSELGHQILSGEATLESMSDYVTAKNAEPEPVSGRQEYVENLVNRYV